MKKKNLNKYKWDTSEFVKLPKTHPSAEVRLTRARPVGKITTDMEPLLFELVDDHQLQAHEVLGLVLGWIKAHYPDAIEKYNDKTLKPVLKGINYGPERKK